MGAALSARQVWQQNSLNSHSDPSQPISDALYFLSNSSYSDVLHSYIRNMFFGGPTTPKPRFIVAAAHVSHIQSSIICAKSNGLEMRIRSGGHDFEGLSYVSDKPFFVLDMFDLRAVNVSIEDETAWVEAGATLGEVYYGIAERSRLHAFPAGMCPTVGVGGQISGGGFGNLMRKYGLAVDNVIDATLVDHTGRLLDQKSMGEDLFWAITGGGTASFGVVLAYKIRLVRVPATVSFAGIRISDDDPNFTDTSSIILYSLTPPRSQNVTNVKTGQSLANTLPQSERIYSKTADKLDDDTYIKLAVNVGPIKKIITATFLTLYLGDSASHVDLMKKSFPELGLTKGDCVDLNWVDSLVRWAGFPAVHPAPVRMKRISDFLKKAIHKKGLELIFKKMKELETPVLKFFPYGGIMDRISSSAKPFPHRADNVALVEIATNWNVTRLDAANYYINLTRRFYECMTPFVSKSREAYLNYQDLDLGINDHGPGSYSEAAAGYGFKYYMNNFDKLVRIKSEVDPDNFFRNEQSIPVSPLIDAA
ncbi:hypothetical protein ACP275_09G062200 [Erythranthe tilingii]